MGCLGAHVKIGVRVRWRHAGFLAQNQTDAMACRPSTTVPPLHDPLPPPLHECVMDRRDISRIHSAIDRHNLGQLVARDV